MQVRFGSPSSFRSEVVDRLMLKVHWEMLFQFGRHSVLQHSLPDLISGMPKEMAQGPKQAIPSRRLRNHDDSRAWVSGFSNPTMPAQIGRGPMGLAVQTSDRQPARWARHESIFFVMDLSLK